MDKIRYKCNLKKYLLENKISYHGFREICNISYPTVVKYANDNVKNYNDEVLAKICMSLNITIGDLLTVESIKSHK